MGDLSKDDYLAGASRSYQLVSLITRHVHVHHAAFYIQSITAETAPYLRNWSTPSSAQVNY